MADLWSLGSAHPLVLKARDFATVAHRGQRRKYTGEPYIEHPAEVVNLLEAYGVTDPVTLAAAWLHDTVEDTEVTVFDLEREFGEAVAKIVTMLTDEPHSTGTRSHRHRLNVERLRRAHPFAQTVKLADLICNTASIVDRDPKFAKLYLREKRDLLRALLKGKPELRKRAWDTVNAGEAKLALA